MLLYLVFLAIAVGICVRVYVKLTTGIVKCSKHLVGKVVIVTGGNGGIGYETAKDLAFRGAKVIIACRDDGRGTTARDKIIAETGNPEVHYRNLDLASLTSVRKFADQFIKLEKRLDILINNAGVVSTDFNKTEDGLVIGMQVNHFGPFLLTNLLLPLLKTSAPSRIINVSSEAHHLGKIDFNNLSMEKDTKKYFSFMKLYGISKLCNILMTISLKRRLIGTGVTVNALHPGVISTGLMNYVDNVLMKYVVVPAFSLVMITPWEGAQTSIYLAVSRDVENVSGLYFADCKEKKTTKEAQDIEVAEKLWEVSENVVKLT